MKKKISIAFVFTFISLGMSLFISNLNFFENLEYRTLDYRFNLRHRYYRRQITEDRKQKTEERDLLPHIDSRLFLVGIDDYDVQSFGQLPWRRKYHSILLEALALYPPLIVGFDIIFAYPDSTHPEDDQQLINSVRLLDAVCLSGYFRPEDKVQRLKIVKDDAIDIQKFALPSIDGNSLNLSPMFDIRIPFKQLLNVSQLGFINAPKDGDGIIRRIPLLYHYNGRVYPSFPLQIIMNIMDIDPSQVTLRKGPKLHLQNNSRQKIIPIDKEGRLAINFRGSFRDFNQVNYMQVIKAFKALSEKKKSVFDLKSFTDKIVLVGLTATGSTDTDPTPMSTISPLIMVHLNTLNNILQNDYLQKTGFWLQVVILFFLALLISIIATIFRPFLGAVLSAAVLSVYISISILLLFALSIWFPWVAVFLIGGFCFGGITFYRFFSEEKEKKKIKKAFGNYLSQNVLEKILRDKTALQLGGTRKTLTVLFLDIVGFTGFSERHTPEEIVQRLNEYFSRMTEIVFKHEGTFDKFVGDELIAFWGAPGGEDNHAIKAVCAALEMRNEVATLTKKWSKQSREILKIGIGINTGEMLVGNMGSKRIMDYTVIGDEVNLAARLEGLTRDYKTDIIISDRTYNEVKHIIDAEFLGPVQVRGRSKPAEIYGVIGRRIGSIHENKNR